MPSAREDQRLWEGEEGLLPSPPLSALQIGPGPTLSPGTWPTERKFPHSDREGTLRRPHGGPAALGQP